jgi:hypothetical protein
MAIQRTNAICRGSHLWCEFGIRPDQRSDVEVGREFSQSKLPPRCLLRPDLAFSAGDLRDVVMLNFSPLLL